MRTMRCAAATAALLVTVPHLLGAQASVLTISLSGITAANVVTVDGGARRDLGQVTSQQPLKVDMALVNAVKGQQVRSFMQRATDGGNTLVFVPRGQRDPICDAAEPRQPAPPGNGSDDAGRCQVLAPFRAGITAEYGVQATGGTISVVTKSATGVPGAGARGGRWRFGLDASYASYGKVQDVACDMAAIPGLTSCTSKGSSGGFGVSVGYQVTDRWSLGVRYGRNHYTVDQLYTGGPVTYKVNVNAFDLTSRLNLLGRNRRIRPFIRGGVALLDNKLDLSSSVFDVTSRSQSGVRTTLGGGVDVALSQRIGAMLDAAYTGLAAGDADTNARLAAGVYFTF